MKNQIWIMNKWKKSDIKIRYEK